jgi:CheY-like chemotaxis protein
MLTVQGQEIDKVIGLELGADDYVIKPFGVCDRLLNEVWGCNNYGTMRTLDQVMVQLQKNSATTAVNRSNCSPVTVWVKGRHRRTGVAPVSEIKQHKETKGIKILADERMNPREQIGYFVVLVAFGYSSWIGVMSETGATPVLPSLAFPNAGVENGAHRLLGVSGCLQKRPLEESSGLAILIEAYGKSVAPIR